MSVLVTGGSGFVGLNVVEALLARGETVVSCDMRPLPTGIVRLFSRQPGKLLEERLDVRDRTALDRVLAAHRPKHIVHAAAMTPAGRSEIEQCAACVAVNVDGTVNVLDAALLHDVQRMVILSSAAVYGNSGFSFNVLNEATPADPVSIYGISKLAAERVALRYRAAGANLVAMRLGSVYGPWEHVSGVRSTPSPIWQALQLALRGSPIRLPRPGRRDWIYARDAAGAIVAALEISGPLPDVVNVGSGAESTVADFCQLVAGSDPRLSWSIDSENPNIDLHGMKDRAPLSIVRLRERLRFTPKFDMTAAAADYVAWATANQQFMTERALA